MLVGMMGILGSLFKVWPTGDVIYSALIGAFIPRLFHSWYSALQVKQSKIPSEYSSNLALVVTVETEVIKRLNIHRNMRRIFGYLIMSLYYAIYFYYSLNFISLFDSNTNYNWTVSFLLSICIEYFVIEFLITYIQIEMINYLKIGGSAVLEHIFKIFLNDEFLKVVN